jgi:hypothetical protein
MNVYSKTTLLIKKGTLLILFPLLVSIAWGRITQEKDLFDFKQAWKEVDSLQAKGLYQEANKKTNDILLAADKEKNEVQFTRVILTKMNLLAFFSEEAVMDALFLVNEHLNTKSEIRKGILTAFRANCYIRYYQQNRYRYKPNENIKIVSENISDWSEERIKTEILSDMLNSLKYKKNYDEYTLFDFEPALVPAREGRLYRPTFYDLMVWNVLDYTLSQPVNAEKVKFDNWELNTKLTKSETLDSSDTWSVSNYLFKELINVHQNRPEAKLSNQIHYLNFVYSNSSNDQKDSLFEISINRLINENSKTSLMVMAANRYAEHLINNTGKFNKESVKYRWNYLRAKELLEKTIAKYPDAPQINHSRNMMAQLLTKSQSLNIEDYILPNQPILVKLNTRNCNKLFYRILDLSRNDFENFKSRYDSEEINKALLGRKALLHSNIEFNLTNDLREHSFEFLMDGLKAGFYAVLVSDGPEFKLKDDLMSCCFINVTGLTYINQDIADDKCEIIVRSRYDGTPIKDAKVSLFNKRYDYKKRAYNFQLAESYKTNEYGMVVLSVSGERDEYNIVIEKGGDVLLSNDFISNIQYANDDRMKFSSTLYTDRLIYRPGQTVFFKGILINNDTKDKRVVANEELKVDLTNVNGEVVGEMEIKTNEFGSYAGQFVLPANGLTGIYTIADQYSSLNFNVEEYKRPKFETYFNNSPQVYQLNSNAVVYACAKAYSGAPVANAKVSYTIYRSKVMHYTWRSFYTPYQPEKVFDKGVITTNDTGGCLIKFLPLPDQSNLINSNYNFRIEVNVTDLSGESHSVSKSIIIGEKEYNFNFSVSDRLETNTYGMVELNDTSRFKIDLNNNEGLPVDRDVKIVIERIKSTDRPLQSKLWEQTDTVLYNNIDKLPFLVSQEEENPANWKTIQIIGESTVKANKYNLIHKLVNARLTEGSYRLKAQALNSKNRQEQSEYYFVVKKRNSIASDLNWFVVNQNKTEYQPGDKLVLDIYTHLKSSNIFYSVEQVNPNSEKPELKSLFLSTRENTGKIEFEIKNHHRGGFFINLSYQENNRSYTQHLFINVPYYNKELLISTESIRDNLLPGSKEKWTVKISGRLKDKVLSEFLCTMYDASLDEMMPNYWQNIFFSSNDRIYNLSEGAVSQLSRINNISYPEFNYFPYSLPSFDEFIYYGKYSNYYDYAYTGHSMRGSRAKALIPQSAMAMPLAETDVRFDSNVADKNEDVSLQGASSMEQLGITKNSLPSSISNSNLITAQNSLPRSNFNETAFFYPQLKTNENGDVVFSFIMPEALTKWKFMGLAHTPDLKSGIMERFITTSKPLMCSPNLPRTFRQGDEVIIKAKIDNISNKQQNVSCKLNLEDELTNSSVNYLINDISEKSILVNANSSGVVSWKLKIKDAPDLLKISTTASGNDYTDGEVNYVPILLDKQLVIETLPFLLDSGYGHFYFESLATNKSDTRIDKHLSIEFTANPIWTAIQSMPYLMEYPHECSEQLFARYFSNKLAHHVVVSHPEIQQTFNKWKIKSPDALISNLQKNPELKQVLLNETPWVFESKDENQQRLNLALLFDLNKMNNDLITALKKLLEAQSPNGGWPWFKGMPDNEYITTHVVEGLLNLIRLGALDLTIDGEVKLALDRAVNYLSDRQKENYQSLIRTKINLKEYVPNREELMRLLVFSKMDEYKPFLLKENNQYFISQAKTHWLKLSLDEKVILAKVLYLSDKIKADEIVNSFKDNAIKNKKIGWYWKENRKEGYCLNSSVELHSEMLELFSVYKPDQLMVKELSKWLLLNKHSNKWDNTKATTKAIYALLLNDAKIDANIKAEISMGKKKFVLNNLNTEPGSGYFKENISVTDLNPDLADILVMKEGSGISYGAVYWKYIESVDKIKNTGSGLTVSKSYFVKQIINSNINYIPISESNLALGDEVMVRLSISSDRDLEFVHLKDSRPSGFEPADIFSGSHYDKGLFYYQCTRDANTDFFFNYIPKGIHEVTYKLKVNNAGNYNSGISTIQCMYAPEFTGTSKSQKVNIKE